MKGPNGIFCVLGVQEERAGLPNLLVMLYQSTYFTTASKEQCDRDGIFALYILRYLYTCSVTVSSLFLLRPPLYLYLLSTVAYVLASYSHGPACDASNTACVHDVGEICRCVAIRTGCSLAWHASIQSSSWMRGF